MLIDIKKLQAQDMTETDLISRLLTATGSMGVKCNYNVVQSILNESFTLNHPQLGWLDSVRDGETQPLLGDYSTSGVVISGGDF